MKYKGYEIEIICNNFLDTDEETYDFEFVTNDLGVYTSDIQFFHRADCENSARHLIDKIEGDK